MPFYLRTGKRLGRRVTEVAVVFKRAPHLPFTASATEELTHNALVIRVQPDEGMTLRFGSKVPGTAMEIRDVNMDFAYGGSFTEASPEAYERLILDVLLGDPPLFPRHEEVELSWKILDPILEHWARQDEKGRSPRRTRPAPGGRRRPTRCWPATDASGGGLMIELTDTNSAAIAAEFVRARTKAGSPAMGMVMTLIIVVDEDDAEDAMAAARAASHEHPARVLGVILGDGRGAGIVNAQVGTGSGWTGETALIRLKGEVVKHPESVVLPLLLPDSPVAIWWPADAPDDPAADPLGALAQRRITDAAAESPCASTRAIHTQCPSYAKGNTDLAWTRLTAVAGAARRRARPAPAQGHRRVGHRRADQPQRRPARGLAGRPAQGDGAAHELRRPGHHRGRPGHQGGPDHDHAAPTASWRRSAPPATPTGRSR